MKFILLKLNYMKMKKIILSLAVLSGFFAQNSFAQDSAQSQPSQLLNSYYDIKNALVAGKVDSTSIRAGEFLKILNAIDYKVISEGNANALLKDAGAISESKDVKKQREYFENLSLNMSLLAKALDLSDEAIYEQYCPMKDAYWLSSEKEIRNPYYGSSMLTCGKVVDIIE